MRVGVVHVIVVPSALADGFTQDRAPCVDELVEVLKMTSQPHPKFVPPTERDVPANEVVEAGVTLATVGAAGVNFCVDEVCAVPAHFTNTYQSPAVNRGVTHSIFPVPAL